MIKSIITFVFFPKKTSKKFINEEIHVRETILILFLVEWISLIVMLSKALNKFEIKSIISAFLFALLGTYLLGAIDALILYIMDKKIFNQLQSYQVCFKLILPILIIDVLYGLISVFMSFLGISLIGIVGIIISVCKLVYSFAIISYYLIKLYKYKIEYIIVVDIVYFILFIIPKIFDTFMF